MRKNILAKKIGFSILELLLVLAITGVLIVCMTPALTRKPTPPDVTQKVTCILGKRYVIQNLFVSDRIGTTSGRQPTPARTGTITLPPGLESFILTMSAGGEGGGATCLDEFDNHMNLGGNGGGGGEFVYRLNVEFKLSNRNVPATVEYTIGVGGAGAVPASAGTGYDAIGPQTKNCSNSPRERGGDSKLRLCGVDSTRCPARFTSDSGCCLLTLYGGGLNKGFGGGYRSDKTLYNLDSAQELLNFKDGKKFFKSSSEEVNTYGNYSGQAFGGWAYSSSYSYAGEGGERSVEILPGLGGSSVFGVGSLGSGGSGGLNAPEKRFNIKRGVTNYTRYGEDGAGGIMILDYDSVCTNRKERS